MRTITVFLASALSGFVLQSPRASVVDAGTARRMEVETLVQSCDSALEARVLSKQSRRDARGFIVSDHMLEVSRAFVGAERGFVSASLPGGVLPDGSGMVLPGMPRLSCLYMVQRATADGRVPVTVRRAGETKTFDLPTTRVVPLVMPTLAGDYPRWFIYGPVAFSAATNQFARTAMTSGELAAALASRGNPLLTRLFDGPAFPGEELVVVCAPLFPHPLSRGYGNPTGGVVATVNGSRVENLLHLVTLLRDAEEEFVTIEFAGEMTMPLVLPREAAEAAVEGILGDNGVRAQGSPDAMRVWQHD